MRPGSVLRSLCVLVMALGLSGCGRQWSWHEKITVEVETPEGPKAASSVIRKTFVHENSWFAPPEARGASQSVSGEAVVLEVAPGKYLFALLKGLPSPFEVFFPGEKPLEVASRMELLRESRTLPGDLYPLLVTFTDIDDPTTVLRVDPSDLAAMFGPGYALKAITLEITDDPLTDGRMSSVLDWLPSYFDRRLDGNRFGTIKSKNPFANELSSGAFITRRSK